MRILLAFVMMAYVQAAAAEDLKWFGNQFDRTTTLVYGIPESDYTPLVFACDRGDDEVNIYVGHDAPQAKDGQEMMLRLAAGGASTEIRATGSFQEIDDLFHLEGRTKLDQQLVDLLSSGGTLAVTIDGVGQEFPLDGIEAELGNLVAACGAPLGPLDLEIKLTNNTDIPVVGFLFSEASVNDFDGDTFGNRVLAPAESIYLVIRDGRKACSFDLRAEFDEDAERDPVEGAQNLCENSEFVVGK